MLIERIICGSLAANCYIIYNKDGGIAYIVDPGYDVKRTQDFVKEHGLTVKMILLTHTHHDHSGKAAALAEYYEIPVCVHQNELDYYSKDKQKLFGNGESRLFSGGEELDLGGETIQVFHTPGHSAGGLCFYSSKSRKVFTGDTIFNVDIGYTHFSGGSAGQMKESLTNIVDKWENDVTIYPGHGDSATMKYVREVNQEFLDMITD